MALDVFISYSSKDKAVADAVCATLESRKIRCWIAPRDLMPSIPFAEAIIDAISKSRLLVLVFSKDSNQSPQVMREVERAVNKGIPILPFRIEDVTPSKSMEYFLSSPHWLDALTPPLEKHLQKLADTVVTILEVRVDEPPPPIIKKQKIKIKPYIYIIAGIVAVVIIVSAIFLLRGSGNKEPGAEPIITSSTPSVVSTSNLSATSTATPLVTANTTPTSTLTPTPTPTPTPTLNPTLTTTSIPAATQKLLYIDDFKYNTSGWAKFSSEIYEGNYENGEYHFRKITPGVGWICNTAVGQFTDFVLEIDVRSVNAQNSSNYGVVFRSSDNNHYYRFCVTAGGFYRIEKYNVGAWTRLKDDTNSVFIKQGDSSNHLMVICKGSQIELYANGNYLTTVSDDSYNKGYIGLTVNAVAVTDVYFDNIKVYGVE